MIPTGELITRRRLVSEFINVDYADVQFITKLRVQTADLSFIETDQQLLPSQRIRIIPANRRFGYMMTNSEAGEIDKWPYVAIGRYDMNVASGYKFIYRGEHYEVKSVDPDNEERTLFALAYYGPGTPPSTAPNPHPYQGN